MAQVPPDMHGVVLADKRSLEIFVFQRVVVTEFWRKLLFVGNRVPCFEAMYFIKDNISPSKFIEKETSFIYLY